ncbi:transcription factor S-II, central domain-containing protein [Cryomyces antarcticus]
MSEEQPRRSGRATKGQNAKLESSDTQTPAPKPAKKGKSKASASKKAASAEPTQSEDNDDDDDSIIRCVCGATTDDESGRRMICCDACDAWQHNDCMGMPEEEDLQPDHYFCEQCRPEEHVELVAAMKRGEKPWEERIKAREEAEKQKRRKKKGSGKKGKGGRPSRASEMKSEGSQDVSSPVPPSSMTQDGSNKPNLQEEVPGEAPNEVTMSEYRREAADKPFLELSEVGQKRRISSIGETSELAQKRRKSSLSDETALERSRAPPDADTQTALVDIDSLPQERKKVADALVKTLAEQIRVASRQKSGPEQSSYRIPDGQTADSLGKHYAALIEYSLFQNHCGTSSKPTEAYATHFKMILFNIKKNPVLLRRLLLGSLKADELSTMSSDEMASEELQKKMAAMKEEADKQAVMIQEEDKPRIRRTHKGEEVVDDEYAHQPSSETVYPAEPVRRRETLDDSEITTVDVTSHMENGSPPAVDVPESIPGERPLSIDTTHPPTLDRKQSSAFNIKNVWSSVQSPVAEPRLLRQPPRRKSSVAVDQPIKPQVDDADIDRMLNDEDEVYSPADVGTDSGVIWHGQMTMPGIASFAASARFAAGGDFSRDIPWAQLFPKDLEISGRIAQDKADEYLCALPWSKNSDITVLSLSPYDNVAEFDKLCDYFLGKGRYAVSKPTNEAVKDIYIAPVERGEGRLPPVLEMLEHSVIEPAPRQDRMLLAFFVVKGGMLSSRANAQLVGHPSTAGSPVAPQAFNHDNNHTPVPQHRPSISASTPLQGPPFTPVDASMGSNNVNPEYMPTYGSPYGQSNPPPQQQPQHFSSPFPPPGGPLPPPHHTNPLVLPILGPFADSPVVAQILFAMPNLGELELGNLRDILEREPATRTDLMALQSSLFGDKTGSGV